jgi:hypothetical protein
MSAELVEKLHLELVKARQEAADEGFEVVALRQRAERLEKALRRARNWVPLGCGLLRDEIDAALAPSAPEPTPAVVAWTCGHSHPPDYDRSRCCGPCAPSEPRCGGCLKPRRDCRCEVPIFDPPPPPKGMVA